MLEIDWNFPVYTPDLDAPADAGRTTARSARGALPRSVAFAEILDADDERPLLVLRECTMCQGSDAALLSRKLDNEKTVLLARWFRCVKLPTDVLQADHPFRNLFDAEHPPHLFLCDKYGRDVVPLDGNQSQTLLWKTMLKVIRKHYRKDPEPALKQIRKLLSLYDILDIKRDGLMTRLDDVLVKHGPKSAKVKKLKRQVEKVDKDKAAAKKREAKFFDLDLQPTPAPGAEAVGAK